MINVEEAKKLIEADKNGGKDAVSTKRSSLDRKLSGVAVKRTPISGKKTFDRTQSKDKLTPSKMVPLNKLSHLPNKTPSMIDLVPESPGKSKAKTKKDEVPAQLTFEDIQKMHYTNLNKAGSQDDEFRPSDFLDLDSGDSDNEILAKFKPE